MYGRENETFTVVYTIQGWCQGQPQDTDWRSRPIRWPTRPGNSMNLPPPVLMAAVHDMLTYKWKCPPELPALLPWGLHHVLLASLEAWGALEACAPGPAATWHRRCSSSWEFFFFITRLLYCSFWTALPIAAQPSPIHVKCCMSGKVKRSVTLFSNKFTFKFNCLLVDFDFLSSSSSCFPRN